MSARSHLLGMVALMAVPTVTPGQARTTPARWVADGARSQIVVHVYKKGLLSGMAHDHHFAVGKFHASATFDEAGGDPPRVEVVIAAASLGDRQPDLSAEDKAKVDAQAAGEDVLHAARYPEIRFASGGGAARALVVRPDGSLDGELAGMLSLHGAERALVVPVHATREGKGWKAKGTVRFKQSDFGIEPYSGFLGTIAVHDEIQVDYDLVLEPEG